VGSARGGRVVVGEKCWAREFEKTACLRRITPQTVASISFSGKVA